MEKIAADTYSFERIHEGGSVYVDKTAILKTLAGVAFDAEMRNPSDRKTETA